MAKNDSELLRRLLDTFEIEAREHLQAMASDLVQLEQANGEISAEVLDATFRHAHSLKGAARAVDASDIESVCQAVESVFADVKRGKLVLTVTGFDVLHRTLDVLTELLAHIRGEIPAEVKTRVAAVINDLHAALGGKAASQPSSAPRSSASTSAEAETLSPAPEERRSGPETVRVSTAKLDAVLLQAEELLMAKQASALQASKLRQAYRISSQWRNKWTSLRPDVRALQKKLEENGNGAAHDNHAANGSLARISEFLEWNHVFTEDLEHMLEELTELAESDHRAVGSMIDNLSDEMKKVVMQPFSTLLELFPRLVRDLARHQNKDVELVIHGSEIEVDRRILEELKDPLIHLIRNCIDHGIEPPFERVQVGKPARGTITISVSAKSGSHIELLVSDNGTGIDVDKLKTAARKMKPAAVREIDAMDSTKALDLVFESGVSTSQLITDISGRGLGLAILKEKVGQLNSSLSVESKPGQGTTFRIVLPLTLARLRGVVARVGENFFVAPAGHVERVARIKKDEIKTVENRETLSVDGTAVSLVSLRDVLGAEKTRQAAAEPEYLPVMILVSANQRIAFVVDEVLREQEVLVKSLGRQLNRVRNIAGATQLESGKIALVLNVPDLLNSAVLASEAPQPVVTPTRDSAKSKKKSVLVAEDSITSRALLKNILESAGYVVETGVDGIDALTKLRTGNFDLVVSDVDMPRMNGFGLTSKIRADKKLAELPVVLVTALDSPADREHGINVGANAYLVKSSFDQSNLLEIVQRLV